MSTIEDLFANQQTLGDELQRIVRNYKKDPADRKVQAYYEKRIQQLQALRTSFESNDDQIRNVENPPLDHSYFMKNYYDETIAVIEQYIAEFEKKLTTCQNQKTVSIDETTVNKTSNSIGLIRKLNAATSFINRRCIHVMEDSNEYTSKAYEQIFSTIHAEWEQLRNLNLDMWVSYENPSSLGYNEEEYLQVEDIIQKTLTMLSSKINNNVTTAQAVQLPKISIPKFSGDYMKWQQFHDLFIEMIDKQEIPAAQKMWYLMSSLSGEAASLVSHLSVTSNNYNTAWQIVKERYDNKRIIVSSLIKLMVDQTGVGQKQTASALELQTIYDNTRESMLALKNVDVDTNTWGPLLIHMLLPKLDRQSRLLYEQSLTNPRSVPDISEFLKFLELRFQSLEASSTADSNKNKLQPARSLATTMSQPAEYSCKLCKGNSHHLSKCDVFISKSIPERLQVVKNMKVCFNCLKNGHEYNKCKSRTCNKCNKKHNTLLHRDQTQDRAAFENSQNTQNSALFSTSTPGKSYILLGTASINITADNGELIKCRAILDSGSQVNLITQKLANQLNLQAEPLKIIVEGIGEGKRAITSSIVTQIHSRTTDYSTTLKALVIPQITSKQPHAKFDISKWRIPTHVKLADPEFNCPEKIDILLGAEFYHEILLDGNIKLSNNLPSIQNSVFGWICIGKINGLDQGNASCGIYSESDEELNTKLTKFWELDEVPSTSCNLNEAEKRCEALFVQNTKRNKDGRFVVEISFKEDPSCIGQSLHQATNRFINLEQKLAKNPYIKQQYIQFMTEYENLGHMEKVQEKDLVQPNYFIPHHCVLKPDSSTTKLRVVFDASAKSSNSISLNDIMYNGPVVQSELISTSNACGCRNSTTSLYFFFVWLFSVILFFS